MMLHLNSRVQEPGTGVLERLPLATVRDWEQYLAGKIEGYRQCPKCGGLGYKYHDAETRRYLEEKIADIRNRHRENNTFKHDWSFLDIGINIVRSSYARGYECSCRKALDFFVKQKEYIDDFKKKGIIEDYVYDITFENVADEKSLNTHVLLSLFTRKKMYKGYKGAPVYASASVLKSADLDFNAFYGLRERRPDFLYLINNGIYTKDYEYYKDRLYGFCGFLYEYRTKKL